MPVPVVNRNVIEKSSLLSESPNATSGSSWRRRARRHFTCEAGTPESSTDDAGKPPQSYIELIAAAIVGSPEKSMTLPARARQPPLLSFVVVRMAHQHPPQLVGERVLREVETRPERTRILLVGARRMRRRLRARRLQPPPGAQPVPVRQ